MRPEDRKYLESHEWAKLEGDDVVIIGITDFAVESLSDLTHIDLPEEGDEVSKGEPFGEIESVKTVSDLNSPVTGEVIAVNQELADAEDFEVLTSSPFDKGWMIKVKVGDKSELDSMLDAKAYEETTKESH